MVYFSRWQKAALVVLSLALLAGVGTLLYGRGRLAALGPTEPFFQDAPTTARKPSSVLVDISGAVAKPGLYRLPAGARVHEALARAGGAAKNADLAAVNLAASVSDGEKIEVPKVESRQQTVDSRQGEGSPAQTARPAHHPQGATQGPKVLPKKPIALNAANAAQLQQLPGIGPVLAQRILQHRQQLKAANGKGFEAKEQLLEVPGIGPKKYADLREYVSL